MRATSGGAVGSGGVEHRRVEEHGVTHIERKLHVIPLEVLDEVATPPGEVAGLVLLGVRQIHRRAGLDGHLAVGDGALQREHR